MKMTVTDDVTSSLPTLTGVELVFMTEDPARHMLLLTVATIERAMAYDDYGPKK